jgi:hypothetical protein
MKQKHETFSSAKSKHADLLAQRARIEAVEEKNRTEADSLRVQLLEAEEVHSTCEKQHIRGVASADELAVTKARMNGLREQFSEAERVAGLAHDAFKETQSEIDGARRDMQEAFVVCCVGIKNGIADSLMADETIRAKLLDAYAAWAHSGAQYLGRWPDFMAGIFVPPSGAEVQTAMEKFRTKHRLA